MCICLHECKLEWRRYWRVGSGLWTWQSLLRVFGLKNEPMKRCTLAVFLHQRQKNVKNTEKTRNLSLGIFSLTLYYTILCSLHIKVKGKAVPLHATEALGGRGGIAPTHSRPRHWMGVSGQRHAPAVLLLPGKGPPVPIVKKAGWAPEPFWTQRIEEKSFAPAGDRTPIARSSSP
jgi:hypothetical protein